MRRRHYMAAVIGMLLALVILGAQTVSNSFPLAFERVDYTATQGQVDFLTKATPRGGFVMVYRNGLLQRQGTPQGDYTSAGVSGGQKITFNPTTPPGLPQGDYVTLIYFR
jgi:hypothetical protein